MKLMPGVEGGVDRRDRRVVVGFAPTAEHHRAEAQRADLDSGSSEAAVLHASDCTPALGELMIASNESET